MKNILSNLNPVLIHLSYQILLNSIPSNYVHMCVTKVKISTTHVLLANKTEILLF